MNRAYAFSLLIVSLVFFLLYTAGSLASAQGELTLEGLAARLDALLGRVDTHEQRLAAIETAIAPTATATHTPTKKAECDASEILVVGANNVSNANAYRFQIILSMGSGCDETDALSFAVAHSALLKQGTVPFHVLFYDFQCGSRLDAGTWDVAFVYAPYGKVGRATEVALGDYSKHEMRQVAASFYLPCP